MSNTYFFSFTGGILIGLAALLLFLMNGKIAGISGIAGGLLKPRQGDRGWRVLFILGMVLGGLLTPLLLGRELNIEINSTFAMLLIGGFLVGLGTRIGSGCTSGHGVCGIARLSLRSIVATLLFMLSAMLTVFIIRHLL